MTLTPTAMHHRGDEVARRRQERAEDQVGRPVAADSFAHTTRRDVAISVVAATEESPGPLDRDRFLTERGHVRQYLPARRRRLALPPLLANPEGRPYRTRGRCVSPHADLGIRSRLVAVRGRPESDPSRPPRPRRPDGDS